VGGSGDAADDYRVEEDAKFLFLPRDLVRPPGEAEPAEFVVRRSSTFPLPVLYAVILAVLVVRPWGIDGKPQEARL
jgi:hypothetical protein